MDCEDILQYQDDCLISIADGKPPNQRVLRALPGPRRILISRIALLVGAMSFDEINYIVDEYNAVKEEE